MFTYAKRVMILHGDKLGPAVLLCDVLHSSELERPHRTGTNVSNLAILHKIV